MTLEYGIGPVCVCVICVEAVCGEGGRVCGGGLSV